MNDPTGETDEYQLSRRHFLGASSAVLAGALAPALGSAAESGRDAAKKDAGSTAPSRKARSKHEWAGGRSLGADRRADAADGPPGGSGACHRPHPSGCRWPLDRSARARREPLRGGIPQVLFPDLNGLRPIDEPMLMELHMALRTLNPLVGPVDGKRRAPFYATAMWQQYPAKGLYEPNALRWMDYGSLKGGFSLFEKAWQTEPRPNILTHRNEADPNELRVVWQQDVHLKPGEAWESAEYWLTPRVGGWAKGIEVYREYVKAVKPPRKIAIPERIRNGLGFQTIWMIPSSECDPKYAACRFKDLGCVAGPIGWVASGDLGRWSWRFSRSPRVSGKELVRGV